MRPSDPRIRANLDRIATNIEAASLATQSYLYRVSQRASPYIDPCLESVSTCLEASCQPCFSARDEHFRSRRHRAGVSTGGRRGVGRDGTVGGFDFYDDWERDEAEWGNDELERLLSGGEEDEQPRRKGGMSYGSRLGGGKTLGKRKGGLGVVSADADPNVVPQSSMFGFLESLPWKIGGRGSGRFRPGVADLQEGIGRKGAGDAEAEVVEESEAAHALLGDEDAQGNLNGRGRSGTMESRSTNNSLSSRGDLFPSDDEADAVPLDDEFAMVLERRTTATSEENSSGRRGGKRPGGSRSSTKTGSSRETRSVRRKGKRGSSSSSGRVEGVEETTEEEGPSMKELTVEEERVRIEEEALVEERRGAAQRLALERGLADAEGDTDNLEDDQNPEATSIVEARELVKTPVEEPTFPSDPAEEHQAGSTSPDQPESFEGASLEAGKPPDGSS